MQELKQLVADYGGQYPWVIFIALVVLPGFGFPASALLLLAGAVWGSHAGSCAIALSAILLNIVWTHAVAVGPGRNFVIRLMGKRWEKWSALPRTDLVKMAWLLRVTPGLPLFVQNYALGVLGIPLHLSLLTALPVVSLYVCGFVLTGGAIFSGRFGLTITGICLVAAAAIAMRVLRSRASRAGTSAS